MKHYENRLEKNIYKVKKHIIICTLKKNRVNKNNMLNKHILIRFNNIIFLFIYMRIFLKLKTASNMNHIIHISCYGLGFHDFLSYCTWKTFRQYETVFSKYIFFSQPE